MKVLNRESRVGAGNTEENLWVQTDTKDEKILIKQQLVSAEQAFIQSVSIGKSNYIENNPSLSEFEKEILFANLQDIIDNYKSIVNQNMNSDASAGDILLQLVPFLNLFFIYCSNLPNSFSLLSKLRERGNFVEVVVEDSFDIPTFEDLLEFPKHHLDDYSTLIIVRFSPSSQFSPSFLRNRALPILFLSLLLLIPPFFPTLRSFLLLL